VTQHNSSSIGREFKVQLISLLKEYKECVAWGYNKMSGWSRNLVELKLSVRLDKNQVKQL